MSVSFALERLVHLRVNAQAQPGPVLRYVFAHQTLWRFVRNARVIVLVRAVDAECIRAPAAARAADLPGDQTDALAEPMHRVRTASGER